MPAYLDTSVLVAMFFRERGSEVAHERARAESQLALSRWTLAEFASAAAFKIRGGHTTEATAREAARRLAKLVSDGSLMLLELERDDFERCAQLCAVHISGLRTPDALHAALAWRERLTLLTFDAAQAAGCAHHGISHELIALP